MELPMNAREASLELGRLFEGGRKFRLAAAESLTGGRIGMRVVEVPGASRYFAGGAVCYSVESKVRVLGVDEAEARRTEGVSEEVALEMARGALRIFGADVAVAVTGFAERAVELPAGAWWAVVGGGAERSGWVEAPAGMGRVEVQEFVAGVALERVVELLR